MLVHVVLLVRKNMVTFCSLSQYIFVSRKSLDPQTVLLVWDVHKTDSHVFRISWQYYSLSIITPAYSFSVC